MKTRVIRYWGGTDWLYRVEEFRDLNKQETILNEKIEEAKAKPRERWHSTDSSLRHWSPTPAGPMWRSYGGPFSLEHATGIASRLAENRPLEDADIIAEFGQ